MKIGVFDSGVGGLSVVNAIKCALPELDVAYRDDKEHVPYGSRQPRQILELATPIIQRLIDDGCQVVVIACNTVSTTVIEDLRARFKVPLVAVEPMVKPAAALTQSGIIAVCATPTTLQSARYAWLKEIYAQSMTVLEPDCSRWAAMIEQNDIDETQINASIASVIASGADVIVLGCTHYHWIEREIVATAGKRAIVLQPEPYVIEQLKQVLAQLA